MVLDLSFIPAVVLIVEDEMILRMFAVDMVEDAGYTPVEAVDADEAIALLESRSDIALMCTDVRMPGSMDGLDLRAPCMNVGRRSRSSWCRGN
jgi:CheY-like chemotaxis protein